MEQIPDYVAVWDGYLPILAALSTAYAVLIFLYHEFRIFLIKDYKEKYDYVNLHEVRYFWYAVIGLIGAFAFYANALASRTQGIFANVETWFYVRTFITLSFLVIAYVMFYSLVKIYYPRYVEKRLIKLRNKPRTSPAGNVMRKLEESEEEAHLEASQFTEQEIVQSVDYDVWLDEKTGFKKIEKYVSSQHSLECPECGYVTLKITKEEIETPPTDESSGLLLKHYRCTYCSHREAHEVTIAPLASNVAVG
jgi:hypothetical protein